MLDRTISSRHPMTTKNSLDRAALAGIRGILFDMDGVLIDSEPLHEFTLLELSELFGHRFETHADLQAFKGLPEKTSADLLLARFPHVRLSAAEIIELRLEKIRQNFHRVKLIAGALDFIKRCRAAGYRLGLTTSADPSIQQLAFATFGLSGFFDAAITGKDVKIGKPDPEPYLLTAARLDIPPGECLVIEDAVNGVLSGKAAGCLVAAITTSFAESALLDAGADHVAASFDALSSKVFGE